MVANASVTPAPVLNLAPADLRTVSDRAVASVEPQDAEEVADAGDAGDDAAPRTYRRMGHHLVRVHLRVAAHGHAAPAGGMGRPAQVLRVHGTVSHAAPARHHGRA